ncbi:MAG: PEGA domain-containing protein [Proteobacteria bacterium]|nr:PEGA domain-containing protein [Pseudomonadota bacterium]
MSNRPRRAALAFVALFVAVVLTGCAGPLKLAYTPTTVAEPVQLSVPPATVLVGDFIDSRGAENPKTIGAISATVSDMNATSLDLAADPVTTVRQAFIDELRGYGFTVQTGPIRKASKTGYILTADLKKFSLDIASRDSVSIELYIELKENSSGSTVWSGMLRETGDRYAGVMGNSRNTINRYLSNSIASLVRSAITASAPAMEKLTPTEPSVEATATEISTTSGKAPPKSYTRGDATLKIVSTPSGAKVYIDDVYWGPTPLTINFYPGIYELRLKKSGYKMEKDKVGLKRGRTTHYETELEKKTE